MITRLSFICHSMINTLHDENFTIRSVYKLLMLA